MATDDIQQWIDAANKRADELLLIEQQTADAAARPIERELAAIMQGLTKRYVTEVGSVYEREPDPKKVALVSAWLIAELKAVNFGHIDTAILVGADKAWAHGIKTAYSALPDDKKHKARIPKELRDGAREAKIEAAERVARAVKLAETSTRWGDLTTSMAKARQAGSSARGYATWVTNRTASEAVRYVAASRDGWTTIIFCERSACVHCAAYAGIKADDKGFYPGGLTYGKKPIHTEPFEGCPLHRFCRCHEELIPVDDERVPAALKREAQRSIAQGVHLESESDKERLAAVSKLLKSKDLRIPKTVQEAGRRAVKSGKF
jgi:hypothetical protein